LSKAIGKKVWELFIKTINISQGLLYINTDKFKYLVNYKLNNRLVKDFYSISTIPLANNRLQIKNIIVIVYTLAKKEKSRIYFFYIQRTIIINKEFITEFNSRIKVS
jgi:hypothetical protein